MPDRRGARFVAEGVFLVALATALAFARIDALEIVGVMLLGWLVVAGVEWSAWRGRPHYGSGMPPRYFVPRLDLPPSQPLEQVGIGYPGGSREEAPTWIASAALRAEALGAWPLAAPAEVDDVEDVGEVVEVVELVEVGDAPDGGGTFGPSGADDPWTVAELPAAPLDEPPAPTQRAASGTARHRLDPLGDPLVRRRRLGRARDVESTGVIEVAARPTGVRPLPGSAGRT